MAEAAIGWVLSPIIKKIVEKAFSYSKSQYNWQKDIRKNLKKLGNILPAIQSVVNMAEHLQSLTDPQKTMLCQLKDAIYDAEDLLDEFDYRIKEAQAKEGGGTLNRRVSSAYKFAKRLIGQDKLADRLKEILTQLDDVRKTAGTFNHQVVAAIQQPNIMHDHVTSSFPPPKHFGRAEEKEKVINLLLKRVDEPESGHTSVPVIAIVGDGGMGKTTLAQLVYHDQRIKDQFDRMWISVPGNFDEISLTKGILKCVYASSGRNKDVMDFNDVMNFNCLQEKLQTEVQQLKQFLLVLDNVWIQKDNKPSSNVEFVNQQLWDTLLAPLQQCKKGSKILVTTRMEIVTNVIGATPFPLKGLSDDETWSLLKRCAFGDEIPHISSELEEIGQRIIKRLNGSPLAAKALAPMLKAKLDARNWLNILERSILDNDDSIRSILQLSYQRLPDHLKYCFAYCSIFPKNWEFKPEKLVLLWIAQGYVLPDGTGRPLMDIGMDYFKQLLSRSLFDTVEQHYVMHDLIHDLVEDISKDECSRIDGGKKGTILKTVRHLGIVANCVEKPPDIIARLKSMSNLKNLRTLMLFGYTDFGGGDLLSGFLQELKSLRVLDCGQSGLFELREMQVFEALCHCLHLRYLNLGPLFFQILPKSLSRLYQLQVLSADMLSLSESIFRLLKSGELKFLTARTLIFKVERKKCHGIGDLKDKDMEKVVQGNLCIENLENVTDKAEAADVDLGSKQYLDGLKLHWDSSSARINGHDADQEITEALKPHRNLKSLTIYGFRGSRCPSWLESKWLDNLQSLCLYGCSELEVLPPLDHLPLLQYLYVKDCPKLMSFPRFPPTLGQIDINETGLFSTLHLLQLSSPVTLITTGISSHTALLHDHHLQAIQDLIINDCKEPMPAKWLRLTALEKFSITRCQKWLMSDEEEDGGGVLPSSLESLHISDCPVTEKWLSRWLQSLTSLKKLTLCNCPEWKSLQQVDGGGVLATSLESLDISSCPVTERWLSRCLQGLTSLKKLKLYDCPVLKSLPQEDGGGVLATSLESLDIYDCPVTERWLFRCLQGLTFLKELRLINCSELKSLPQEDGGGVLATSLEALHISSCPVTERWLSRCLQGLTSLKKLRLCNCPVLKSLPQEDGGGVLATSLESLYIYDCPVTERWLSRCLQGLTFLKELTLCHCSELKSLPLEDGSSILPPLLESLDISNCPVTERWLSRCLQGLTSLKKLTLSHCSELKSLPLEDGSSILPPLLESLYIKNCPVIERWLSRCLQGLTFLKMLTLCNCSELKSLPQEDGGGVLPSLKSLIIALCPVTDLSFINYFTSLQTLTICYCPELKSLPESLPTSLESLETLTIHNCPVTDLSFINHFTSLKTLKIYNCRELKSLPESLPTSLEVLRF